MSGPRQPEPLSASLLRVVDAICDQFEQAFRRSAATDAAALEDYLHEAPEGCRSALLIELAAVELLYRQRQSNGAADWDAFVAAHPTIAVELRGCRSEVEAAMTTEPAADSANEDAATQLRNQPFGLHVRCPHCCCPVELVADASLDDVTCRECGSTFCLVDREEVPSSTARLQKVGRFELLSRLGVGGFGTVWKARDEQLDRIVALKIPRRGQLREAEAEFFFREARAAAQLRHPNIVPVHEIGRADEAYYIVSDLVRGDTLSQWMGAERRTAREAARMGATIAEALHYAHQRGIVHRDLKPSNVMVDELGEPQIMDFGLAKRESGEATMTLDGQIIGTAAYMSPEQAAGRGHWIDRRADVYSLGVVLFEMATDELPYRGNFDAQLLGKLRDDAPNPRSLNPRVPKDYATICLKCLERDPNGRYATAEAVAAELRRFLAGEPVLARPIGPVQRGWRWAKRRPTAATALGLGVVLAIGGPIAAVTINRQRQAIIDKIDELHRFVGAEQAGSQDLAEKIADLQRTLEAVRGDDAGQARLGASWRQSLIARIVDRSDFLGDDSQADDADAEQSAQRELAAGMLLAEIGRSVDAAARLESAKSRLESLVADRPAELRFSLALADCCEQLASVCRATGDIDAAQRAAAEAFDLRRRSAQRAPHDAVRAVDVLAARYETVGAQGSTAALAAALSDVPALTQRILDDWPTDAASLYEAACRLTLRTPHLSTAPTGPPAGTSD